METLLFDKIRPYNDAEVAKAMQRLKDSPYLSYVSRFVGCPEQKYRDRLAAVDSVGHFICDIMSEAMETVVSRTTSGFTYDGLENLKDEDGNIRKCLFLSTHRDIVLDPALIQLIFYRENLPFTDIAVGDNLIENRDIEDIMRSNRMVKVIRSGNARYLYASSILFSDYIRQRITKGESSIWLAHRQGRTKNGYDLTEQGLVKMLELSGRDGEKSFVENFAELNIVPVAISYEYESCGLLKALELLARESCEKYEKKPGEDLNSIITGITQTKGRVHVQFCKPISEEELRDADSYMKNDKYRRLAEIVDGRLHENYRLWPTNYAAYDIIHGTERFADKYTKELKEQLLAYAERKAGKMPADVKLRMLSIYAAYPEHGIY